MIPSKRSGLENPCAVYETKYWCHDFHKHVMRLASRLTLIREKMHRINHPWCRRSSLGGTRRFGSDKMSDATKGKVCPTSRRKPGSLSQELGSSGWRAWDGRPIIDIDIGMGFLNARGCPCQSRFPKLALREPMCSSAGAQCRASPKIVRTVVGILVVRSDGLFVRINPALPYDLTRTRG